MSRSNVSQLIGLAQKDSDLVSALLVWWECFGRCEFVQKPWMFSAEGMWPRSQDSLDPYGIWIAEVMLQQTQLAVALPFWTRWMAAFPSVRRWPGPLWIRCGCSGRVLAHFGLAGCMRRRRRWWADPGPHVGGLAGVTGIGHHRRQHLSVPSMLRCRSWTATSTGAGATDGPSAPAGRDDALFWSWSEACSIGSARIPTRP